MTDTERLDIALASRGFARSRSHARQLIDAGAVTVNQQVATRPAFRVQPDDDVVVVVDQRVSRAGGKLAGALDDLGVAVPRRCVDIGSSTGGFTQELLDRGAQVVFAVDVGTDQLVPELRSDPRVRVRERTNARHLTRQDLDGALVELAVADVSFISLTLLLPAIFGVLQPSGEALLMVKPQFEVGRERVGAGGVVRDDALRQEAVEQVVGAGADLGWSCIGRAPSRVPGPSGNLEYFCWFRRSA